MVVWAGSYAAAAAQSSRCPVLPSALSPLSARLPPPRPTCRRTRGDGNCFFRSFFFGLLEHLLLSGDAAERERLLRRLEALKQPMVEAGYDEMGALAAAALGHAPAEPLRGPPPRLPLLSPFTLPNTPPHTHTHTPLTHILTPPPNTPLPQCWRRRWTW